MNLQSISQTGCNLFERFTLPAREIGKTIVIVAQMVKNAVMSIFYILLSKIAYESSNENKASRYSDQAQENLVQLKGQLKTTQITLQLAIQGKKVNTL